MITAEARRSAAPEWQKSNLFRSTVSRFAMGKVWVEVRPKQRHRANGGIASS
jgi:hypothetical protein